MKITELYPARFATGQDLNGKSYTLVIAAVEFEEVHTVPNKPPERKPVIYFKGTTKGAILTRPLAFQIAEVLKSPDTDEWIGKKITIFPQPMTVAGQPRVAIRARASVNGENEPPAAMIDQEEE